MLSNLPEMLSNLQEQEVLTEVKSQLANGVSALDIFADLQKDMDLIGKRFEAKEYFLSELIMSADIFKTSSDILEDKMQSGDSEGWGTVVLGTVYEDIHDIGKNIVATVLKCNGVNVIDLGVNVPVEKFVETVQEHQPDFVGLSCLLTTAFDNMKATVEALSSAGLREGRTVMIGGGPVDQSVCDYVGADMFCKSVQEAVDEVKKIKGVK